MRLFAVFGVNIHEIEAVAQIIDADVAEIAGNRLDQLTVNVDDFGIQNLVVGKMCIFAVIKYKKNYLCQQKNV